MDKSGVLDQLLMEDIARHCPQQFLALHQCMAKGGACDEEQKTLAGCIRGGVPTFQRIQGECADKLKAYEGCLRGTTGDCKKELVELRQCASGTLTN